MANAVAASICYDLFKAEEKERGQMVIANQHHQRMRHTYGRKPALQATVRLSFWQGFGSIIDLGGPNLDTAVIVPTSFVDDAEQLRADWETVGNDLWLALNSCKNPSW